MCCLKIVNDMKIKKVNECAFASVAFVSARLSMYARVRVLVSLVCMRVRARVRVCARVVDSIHITSFYSFFNMGRNRRTYYFSVNIVLSGVLYSQILSIIPPLHVTINLKINKMIIIVFVYACT